MEATLEESVLAKGDSFLFVCGVHKLETTDREQAIRHMMEQHGLSRDRAERAL